ncbi:PREDICTED: signal-transducing adaptor protein 2 isoform X2 [Crocodylus porosus]|uniref:signal-transducing adaptor protein 2 isoform X2 n=1 Tax=Crocodylus porosus TaxID=8502 RepID=UPI000938CF50|nr:PREDICTED: signal-transducing adaptor protein 2 isoform X2 [Crocodylus porosus]
MAQPLRVPRTLKPKQSLPPHYYESFLEKKGPRDKVYKRYWTGLRGRTLHFYHNARDAQPVEKIDLDGFMSLTDAGAQSSSWGGEESLGLSLKLLGQEVKLKAENLESREMWKGFILTIMEMKVPSNLTLLPGHLYMMSEALAKEQERQAQLSHYESTTLCSLGPMEQEMPECFFKVSRTEAQVLLEKNQDCGNLLLRPGGDGKSISVTTRQILNGTPLIKHYRVNCLDQDYILDVEQPYHCSSLTDVVNYFVSNTKNTLVPLCLDQDYSKELEFVDTDKENGESVWTAPQPPIPRGAHAPARRAGVKGGTVMPPQFKNPVAKPLPPVPAPDSVYEDEDEDEDETYVNDKEVAEIKQMKASRDGRRSWAPIPSKPSVAPKPWKDSSSFPHPGAVPIGPSIDMSEELRLKLQKRLATLQD